MISNTSASASTLSGSCLCNAIRYTLHGDPVTTVLCHCRNCKKSSGSSFQANLFYKKEQLTFLTGEDKLTQYLDQDTDSGGTPTRMFCSICGSNVITTNETNNFVAGHVIVMSGCLDGEVKPEPKQEFYCKDKCGWMEIAVDTQKFKGMV